MSNYNKPNILLTPKIIYILVCFSSSCEPFVSLDCPFVIAPSVICNICLMATEHKDNYSQEIILLNDDSKDNV
jgi:hypothetical protein